MHIKKLFSLSLVTSFLSLAIFGRAFAAVECLVLQGIIPSCSSPDKNSINVFIGNIVNLATAIIGLITVAVIIVAGIQIISSAGNPEAIASAKKRLFQAVLGLALLIMMRAIFALIGVTIG
ncbi:MAG: hypothetical protein Q8P54_01775 [bacterium]|nr:hypothetical protein [bacterium]